MTLEMKKNVFTSVNPSVQYINPTSDKVRGDLCQTDSSNLKGKIYKMTVRPALIETQAAEPEVVELKILRFLLVVTRTDGISNEYIRGNSQFEQNGNKVREARLRQRGHL